MKNAFDVVVIGGGVVGASLGYGIAQQNVQVAVIDEAPGLSRASRANVGLIWYQCNGKGNPGYSRWCYHACKNYSAFAEELHKISGIDTGYMQTGGIEPALGEDGFLGKLRRNEAMTAQNIDHFFPVRMLERSELESMAPKVVFGAEVTGGSYCEHEGWLDPLALMFALRKGLTRQGGVLLDGCRATHIYLQAGEYIIETDRGRISAERIALAAGLGVRKLAIQLGFNAPVSPNGGHKLLFERVPDVMPVALQIMMRTKGGNALFGAEHRHSWTGTATEPDMLLRQMELAARFWPALKKLRLVRSWFGLRVMPDDGFPIYDTIPGHEKGYMITMHNAVTQASLTATHLARYVLGTALPDIAPACGLDRFNVHKEAAK